MFFLSKYNFTFFNILIKMIGEFNNMRCFKLNIIMYTLFINSVYQIGNV